VKEIPGPCEIGDTQGPELNFGRMLDFLDKHKKYILFFIIFGGALVSLFASSLDALVNSQLFFPDRVLVANPGELGMPYEDIAIETRDKLRLHAWWIPAKRPKAVLLFFHGNAGNISHRLDNLKLLYGLGISCLIPDYRGYGQSEGHPDEKGFYLDAHAAYGAVMSYATQQGAPLVIFGRSLGGAAAVEVGNGLEVSGVILESTFTNLGDMAKSIFPIPGLDSLLSGRFNSLGRIEAIKAPLLMFHGDQDEIVPYRLGRELFEKASQPKEFVTLKGAHHNDTVMVGGPDYLARISRFVDSIGPKQAQ
jgi:fermentation-respiration switch protein FrsA (DUF1100 family)